MNLPPPPDGCDPYNWDLYRFLQHPVFDQLRLNPRSVLPSIPAGQLYYDSSNGLQLGNGSAFSGVGGSYVQRDDGTLWDHDETTLTSEDAWTNCTFSVIPASAVAVEMECRINLGGTSDNKGFWISLATNGGQLSEIYKFNFVWPSTNQSLCIDVVLPLLDGPNFKYWRDSNRNIGSFDFGVRGWWL